MIHVNRLPTLVRQHIAAFRALLVFTVLCGIIYPVVMVGVAQVAFKNQADGSLVTYNGKVVGSSLCARSSSTRRATRCCSTSSRGRPTRPARR